MINEEVREERHAWSPAPQLPKLAPPVDRTGTTGGAQDGTQGVEANFDWGNILGTVLNTASKFL
ncbi:hypothetical protein [Streptomyces sp. 1331.2]|uniref:hypothetical protein n=1 Tax=Streptomyces sp. 1331.2 TaxID=1938835 RepID=UPI000BC51558|nr:hypothetical protein [Streptomyces sp. 1331.2]SOB88849.1 hypothetical protein SAMN06272789_7169 [Streptomyces sp. 1331.2]